MRPDGIGVAADAPWTHLGDACLTPTGVTEGPCPDLAALTSPGEPRLELLAWSLEPYDADAEGRPRVVHRFATRIIAASDDVGFGVRLHCTARSEPPTDASWAARLARSGAWGGRAAKTLQAGQSTVVAANHIGRLDGSLADYACRIELVDTSASPGTVLTSLCPEHGRCPAR